MPVSTFPVVLFPFTFPQSWCAENVANTFGVF
jgi:hypothetical protein